MRLNIIGNGFDLYHGLPSSYYFFGCYLINNNPEFYEEIGKMYNFKFAKMVGPSIAHDYEYVLKKLKELLINLQKNMITHKLVEIELMNIIAY